ncbi:hypothetical protein GRI40_02775 [Altererythrobacter aerius]|uniref:Glycosyl transferase n=1 Tax=Tsuneonella aeria TaxID=1837929 RepID=A0A6I4TD80_9SPHN|nr:hypothetical protein [Tsuneonella aeria]MXO74145.1 hypothetical protein [Tsuneonella aeria]
MSGIASKPRPRVLFLFNHDAAHQAAHVAGIMAELTANYPAFEVIAAFGTAEIASRVRQLIGEDAARGVSWADLSLPGALDAALSAPNRIAPLKRLARLRYHMPLFATVDAVVSPERTCLMVRRVLRKKMGNSAPRFVFVPHGAGDRNVTYHPALSQFDHYLVSGQKVVDELVRHGLATEDQCRVVGYAKFDTVTRKPDARLFANDLPTIVYNPHFDPCLSSWYDQGPALLETAARQWDRFNLVFAPHVMLFRKSLHVSLEYRTARKRPPIPRIALEAPNIHVDVDSPRLFDMTYTAAADIYLGDVSSQVYEFLREPGTCIFLDAARQGPAAYQFWQNGPVVTQAADVWPLVERWGDLAQEYRSTQERLFHYTMDIDPARTASERGADALAELFSAPS